jgi:hypothetical protein
VPLATAPASGDLDRRDDADAPLGRAARHLRHGALGVMVGDSGHTEATTRQVINKRSGRPGAIGGIGVQMEVDRVRRCQCQRLRRRGGCSNVLGGSAGRVCQGCPPETRGRARRLVLPGSLADVSRPEFHLELVQCPSRGSQER